MIPADDRGPEDGDTVSVPCRDCSDRYRYTYGAYHDPPRSSSRCPDCHASYQKIRDARVSGGMRIRDESVRSTIIAAIEKETRYEVYVEERVGDVYIYDPDDV